MDFFFNTLKTGLVATMFVVFAFVAIYTPQLPTSTVQEAEAGAGGFATFPQQVIGEATRGLNLAQNTLNAGANVSSWIKENVLDGLGWAIAKRIVSGMIRSLIDWVNSGFQGKPAFIQDFKGFLLNIADEEIGRVISELGEIGSFICSPFRLDVQVSVAMEYQRARSGQVAPTCTLTGVIDNVQGFIDGVDPGNGLADWFTITSTPQTYTPYGAALSAQATARARLINAQGEEVKLLDFGDGFLSQKLCRNVSGFTGSQDCSIVKPGKIIQEALTFNLDSGRQSLVEADEINELIGALLGQLANQALTGVAGLLGLSGNDGFGGYSSDLDYLDSLVDQANDTIGDAAGDSRQIFVDALAQERSFRDEAGSIRAEFVVFIGDARSTADITTATLVVADIDGRLTTASENITTLETMLAEYDRADDTERAELVIEYFELRSRLTDEGTASQLFADWEETAEELGIELE